MPTSRNNREAIESRLAAAEEAVEKYGKDYTKGMQIPFRYLHPVTLQWMIQVICQGRADSQIAALEQVKADLRDMEISGLEEIGGLEKDQTDEEEYRNKKKQEEEEKTE